MGLPTRVYVIRNKRTHKTTGLWEDHKFKFFQIYLAAKRSLEYNTRYWNIEEELEIVSYDLTNERTIND